MEQLVDAFLSHSFVLIVEYRSGEVHYIFAVRGIFDPDRTTADLAVLDVALLRDRRVEYERYLLPAIRAGKEVFYFH